MHNIYIDGIGHSYGGNHEEEDNEAHGILVKLEVKRSRIEDGTHKLSLCCAEASSNHHSQYLKQIQPCFYLFSVAHILK